MHAGHSSEHMDCILQGAVYLELGSACEQSVFYLEGQALPRPHGAKLRLCYSASQQEITSSSTARQQPGL